MRQVTSSMVVALETLAKALNQSRVDYEKLVANLKAVAK